MSNMKRMTLEDLKLITAPLIPTKWVSEITGVSPSRLAEYARTGQLKWNTMPSGNRILHSRAGLIKFLEGGCD